MKHVFDIRGHEMYYYYSMTLHIVLSSFSSYYQDNTEMRVVSNLHLDLNSSVQLWVTPTQSAVSSSSVLLFGHSKVLQFVLPCHPVI